MEVDCVGPGRWSLLRRQHQLLLIAYTEGVEVGTSALSFFFFSPATIPLPLLTLGVFPGSQGSDLQWAERVKGLDISVGAAIRERCGGWEPAAANELRVGRVGDQLLLWRAEQGQGLLVGDRAEAPRATGVRGNKAFKATGVRRDNASKE